MLTYCHMSVGLDVANISINLVRRFDFNVALMGFLPYLWPLPLAIDMKAPALQIQRQLQLLLICQISITRSLCKCSCSIICDICSLTHIIQVILKWLQQLLGFFPSTDTQLDIRICKTLDHLRDNDFLISVFGRFSSGKSTLLNAVLANKYVRIEVHFAKYVS